jgi:hypothetical protein
MRTTAGMLIDQLRHRSSGAAGYAIAPAFLLLAGFMLLGPDLLNLPHAEPVAVSRADISSAPLRTLNVGEPMIRRGPYDLRCNECHSLLPPRNDAPRQLMQHRDIHLDHGMNDRCFNCHDHTDRDRLLLQDGSRITFAESARLCARCHGTVYRDWERGMHGRTEGSWDSSRPEHRRLLCVECHDPHAPAITDMTLLPGPNTMRMTKPGHDAHGGDEAQYGGGKRNPLRQWAIGNHDSAAEPGEHEDPLSEADH